MNDNSINDTSLNMNNPDTKTLKLTQISKYLSQDASSINKLNELSMHREASMSPKKPTTKANAKKKPKLGKKTSKLNLNKLNSSGCLNESIAMQTQASKYFKRVEKAEGDTGLKESTSEQEESAKKDAFHCPICQIDLSNDENRQVHVNQCLDQGFSSKAAKKPRQPKEVSKPAAAAASEVPIKKTPELNIEDAVPNCPICGKVFQTHNSRQNHLKKCAQTFHIKTESLFELIKKQQESLEHDLARGLVPTNVYFIKRKNPDSEASKKEAKKKASAATSDKPLAPKKETKAEKKKLQFLKESALVQRTAEERKEILTTRYSVLCALNHIKYGERTTTTKQSTTPFVKTKFKGTNNYLWNRCRYMAESDDCFYVQAFLDAGKFAVGQQMFIQKMNESKYENVEVINTQTALLLAELNDQTAQENMSIYYSQTQQRLDCTALNLTNKTLNDSETMSSSVYRDQQSQYFYNPTYPMSQCFNNSTSNSANDKSNASINARDDDKEDKEQEEGEVAGQVDESAGAESCDMSEDEASQRMGQSDCEKVDEDCEQRNQSNGFVFEQSSETNEDQVEDMINDSIENILSDANNDVVELSSENIKGDEPKVSMDQSLLSTENSPAQKDPIRKPNEDKEDIVLVEDDMNTSPALEVILVDEPINENVELTNLPQARICNFLMSSSDSEANSLDDVLNVPELPKQARLTDIDTDNHMTSSERSTEQNVVLIDETVLSSDTDDGAEPEEVLVTSEEHESGEDSNILDQNVQLDDTCLDESSLSGTRQLDEAIDQGQFLAVSNESSAAQTSLTRMQSLDDSVNSDNEISPTQLKKPAGSMKEKPIELFLDKDVITCGVESNGHQSLENSINESFGEVYAFEEPVESDNDSLPSLNKSPRTEIILSDGEEEDEKKEGADFVTDLNCSYKPITQQVGNISKKRKSIECIQLMQLGSPAESKKFKRDNTSMVGVEDGGTCSALGTSLKENSFNCGVDNQVIDDVWDNFGDQNQFDQDFYGCHDVIQNNSVLKYCTEEIDQSLHDRLEETKEPEMIDGIWDNFSNEDQFEAYHCQSEISFKVPGESAEDNNNNRTLLQSDPENEPDLCSAKPDYGEERTPVKAKKTHVSKLKKRTAEAGTNNSGPLTPMVNYGEMNTPNLKEELKRYGVKPLSKKQSIKKLVEIYEFTHRKKLKKARSCMDLKAACETGQPVSGVQASEKCFSVTTTAKKRMLKKSTSINFQVDLNSETCTKEQPATKKKLLKKQTSDVGITNNVNRENTENRGPLIRTKGKPPKPPSSNSKQQEQNQQQAAATTNLELTIVDQLNDYGELDMDSDEEDSESTSTQSVFVATSSQKAKKVPKQLDECELRQFVHAFIVSDEATYLDVLNYIPLDIEAMNGRLKEALKPRRCNNKLLMKVLDEFCVTFTMKNCSTKTHQGKPKYQKRT